MLPTERLRIEVRDEDLHLHVSRGYTYFRDEVSRHCKMRLALLATIDLLPLKILVVR